MDRKIGLILLLVMIGLVFGCSKKDKSGVSKEEETTTQEVIEETRQMDEAGIKKLN